MVLVLTLAAQSWGAPAAGDGWRPRGAVKRQTVAKPSVRQVGFEDDIAGPALRTAGRIRHDQYHDHGYRVAQTPENDPLRDSFSQPFGVDRPAAPDADTADSLFDDEPATRPSRAEALPPGDTTRQPNELFNDEPTLQEPTPTPDSFQEPAPEPPARGSLFDEETDNDDLAEGLSRPFESSAGRSAAEARRLAEKNCEESLAAIKASRISEIDLSITPTGEAGEDYPYACTLDDGTIFAPRLWCDITYTWKATGLCHKPLYFEDVHLERYGHSWGPYVQPLVSGAHFFGRLPILPYMMGLQTPDECVYTLGHYRPGDCAPYLIDPVPFTWRAALFQAGATVGVAAILP